MTPKSLRHTAFQFFVIAFIVFMLRYLYWRLTSTLDDASNAYLAISLLVAEILGFLTTLLHFASLWEIPEARSKISSNKGDASWSESSVDFLITVCGEPLNLVKQTIRATQGATTSHSGLTKIYVLDDGGDTALRDLCLSMGLTYIHRLDTKGFKAGNLNHGLAHSKADFFVIVDADTKLMPRFLSEVLPNFNDTRLGWVQTSHQFTNLMAEYSLGAVKFSIFDPYYCNADVFYKVIQNWSKLKP